MARRSTAQPVLPFGELTQQAGRVEGCEVAVVAGDQQEQVVALGDELAQGLRQPVEQPSHRRFPVARHLLVDLHDGPGDLMLAGGGRGDGRP